MACLCALHTLECQERKWSKWIIYLFHSCEQGHSSRPSLLALPYMMMNTDMSRFWYIQWLYPPMQGDNGIRAKMIQFWTTGKVAKNVIWFMSVLSSAANRFKRRTRAFSHKNDNDDHVRFTTESRSNFFWAFLLLLLMRKKETFLLFVQSFLSSVSTHCFDHHKKRSDEKHHGAFWRHIL